MVSTYWSRTDHSEQVESNCPNATFRPGEEEWGGRSEDFAPHSSSVLSDSACSQAEPARPVLFRSWSSLIFRLSFGHSFCSFGHHERPRRSWSCGVHVVQHTNRKTYCHSSLHVPLLPAPQSWVAPYCWSLRYKVFRSSPRIRAARVLLPRVDSNTCKI